MSKDLGELESWFAERPAWLQDAARRIVHKGQIGKDDLQHLVKLCKAEAGIYDSGTQISKPSGIGQGPFTAVTKRSILRLMSIFDLTHISILRLFRRTFGSSPSSIFMRV
jgi:hypothetical protein